MGEGWERRLAPSPAKIRRLLYKIRIILAGRTSFGDRDILVTKNCINDTNFVTKILELILC